jgi:hypothetical protein
LDESAAEAMSHVVEDDDSVIVPAAPEEYLGHQQHASPRDRHALLLAKSLEARRTAIPILLVSGAVLALAGVLKFVVPEASPLHDFPDWMGFVFFGVAAPLLALGILNMLQVRSELMKKTAEKTESPGA